MTISRSRLALSAVAVAVLAIGSVAVLTSPAGAASPPTVTAVSPSAGTTSVGAVITVNGTNLTGATAVKFGATAGTSVHVVSATRLTVVAPAHTAGTVDLRVTTPAGTSSVVAADRYTYVSRPQVSALTPSQGITSPGTRVTVYGANLSGATAVFFDNTAATALTPVDDHSLVVTAPAHTAGTVDVRVTTVGGTSNVVAADQYTYVQRSTTGSVFGKVTTNSGAGIAGVKVVVFSDDGPSSQDGPPRTRLPQTAITRADGLYSIVGLAPSANGLFVCFDGAAGTSGSSTTGYLKECYNNVSWDGDTFPSATRVPLSAGVTTYSINAKLDAGAAIKGKVTARTGGAGLAGVSVQVLGGPFNNLLTLATSAADGTYIVTGINPTPNQVSVCFVPSQATGGSSPAGYLGQCYHDVDISDGSTPPTGTPTLLTVSPGATVTGVDQSLPSAAGISGTVTSAASGNPVSGVEAEVFPAGRNFPTMSAATDSSGHYLLTRLDPGTTYRVCFRPPQPSAGSGALGYENQCYNNIGGWDTSSPPPAGTAVITVAGGAVSSGKNAALKSAGAIAGKVTAASNGVPLAHVGVQIFLVSGSFLLSGSTDSAGNYRIAGLQPSSTGYVVCFGPSITTSGPSTVGYRGECYQNRQPFTYASGAPSGVTLVAVTGGSTTGGINAALDPASAVSGRVTAAANGTGLGHVFVAIYDPAHTDSPVYSLYTDDSGNYRVASLEPFPSGYVVCFGASTATGGPSTTGYESQCWNDIAWDGLDEFGPAPDATPVPTSAGVTATGINAALASKS